MEFIQQNLFWIATTLLGLLSMALGTKWTTIKSKFKETVKEGSDVIMASVDMIQKLEAALEDDKITPTEIEMIKKEAEEVSVEWKELVAIWKKDPKVPLEDESTNTA